MLNMLTNLQNNFDWNDNQTILNMLINLQNTFHIYVYHH